MGIASVNCLLWIMFVAIWLLLFQMIGRHQTSERRVGVVVSTKQNIARRRRSLQPSRPADQESV